MLLNEKYLCNETDEIRVLFEFMPISDQSSNDLIMDNLKSETNETQPINRILGNYGSLVFSANIKILNSLNISRENKTNSIDSKTRTHSILNESKFTNSSSEIHDSLNKTSMNKNLKISDNNITNADITTEDDNVFYDAYNSSEENTSTYDFYPFDNYTSIEGIIPNNTLYNSINNKTQYLRPNDTKNITDKNSIVNDDAIFSFTSDSENSIKIITEKTIKKNYIRNYNEINFKMMSIKIRRRYNVRISNRIKT